MAAKKTIVVIGATGNQGGSVARTFLSLPTWHVKAVTRNPSSDAAKALASSGAELVKGDLKDKASLQAAFANANAIFLNTEFWSVYYPTKAALEKEGKDVVPASKIAFDHEQENGRNAVDAAAEVPTLERFIYSALNPISKGSGGKYTRSLHSDGKSAIVDYIEQKHPALAAKTSVFYSGVFHTNRMLEPRLDPNSGKYSFALPVTAETVLPILNAYTDIGPFVRALIEDEPAGTKLLGYASQLTAQQVVQEWSKASGKEALFVPITCQFMHEKFGLPWELLDAPASLAEFGYTAGVDGIVEPKALKSNLQIKPWEQVLKEKDWSAV